MADKSLDNSVVIKEDVRSAPCFLHVSIMKQQQKSSINQHPSCTQFLKREALTNQTRAYKELAKFHIGIRV